MRLLAPESYFSTLSSAANNKRLRQDYHVDLYELAHLGYLHLSTVGLRQDLFAFLWIEYFQML